MSKEFDDERKYPMTGDKIPGFFAEKRAANLASSRPRDRLAPKPLEYVWLACCQASDRIFDILSRDGSPMPMTTQLARTPLYDWHVAHGGRMVDFAGWSMPVQYALDRRPSTRPRARPSALFDVSHMGRLRFDGPDAARVSRRAASPAASTDMRPGQIRYSLVCNDSGGILDDVLVYHLQRCPSGRHSDYQLVVNASNREKIVELARAQLRRATRRAARRRDDASTAMIAVQGPQAIELVEPLVECDLAVDALLHRHRDRVRRHRAASSAAPATRARTAARSSARGRRRGRSGRSCSTPARAVGGEPVGLGARDTLRLEAACRCTATS